MAKRPNKAREQKKAALNLQRTVKGLLKTGKCAPALSMLQHLAQLPGGSKRASRLKGAFVRNCLSAKRLKARKGQAPVHVHQFPRDDSPSGMRHVAPRLPRAPHHFLQPRHRPDGIPPAFHRPHGGGGYSPVSPASEMPSRFHRARGMHGSSPYTIE